MCKIKRESMRLSELKTGEKGVVVKVLGHGGFRKRIVEMGFIKGKTVEVLLNAPLMDPVKYRIMGYEISLRRSEADMIEVVSRDDVEVNNSLFGTEYKNPKDSLAITEEELIEIARGQRRQINVALVGNPNCGKTSLFNLASGAHEHVGNYSGVTVDAKEGYFDFQGYHFKIVDLPGTYSLSAYSPEEVYVRKHIIEDTPDIVINVIDSSNLERNLYLTTQLIDMNVRVVAALNMYDELEASGNKLDYVQLGRLFGIPMIPTVCKKGLGVDQLFHTIIELYEGVDFIDKDGKLNEEIVDGIRNWHNKYVPDHDFAPNEMKGDNHVHIYRHIHINHGPEIEQGIKAIQNVLKKNASLRDKFSTRFLAIKSLERDKEVDEIINSIPEGKEVLKIRDAEDKRIQAVLKEDSEAAITNAKYGFIAGALKETFVDNKKDNEQMTKALDTVFTHRLWGYPVFFLMMYLMFECTFILGDYPMQWIEWAVARLGDFISSSMSDGPLKDLLVDGIIGGVGGVIVFLPNILILYLCISIMEDSGYMARAAFIMDKIMHKMGLHGKSFIPLLMGFGCNVPAVMATRTIENRKSRLITMLIVPLMSCSARLPVYLLFAGAFFPKHSGLVMFSMYTIGIILSVLMARLFSRFFVKGDDSPFVMELPPYRMPTGKSIFRHTWEKGKQYLKKMGGIIMVASIIIWFLGYYPNHDSYSSPSEQQENSYIGAVGKAIEPVLSPLGFDWQLGVGLISGAGAKELVVSTLSVLYTDDAESEDVNIAGRLGISPLVAFCYMLFVLLYFPCVATIVAIKEESGSWKWAAFAMLYTTLLAWIVTFAVYQIGCLFM